MDMKQIKALMQEFDGSGLSKLKIAKDDFTIELEKVVGAVAAPIATIQAAPAVAAPAAVTPVHVEAV